jgi:hypothetical protein
MKTTYFQPKNLAISNKVLFFTNRLNKGLFGISFSLFEKNFLIGYNNNL